MDKTILFGKLSFTVWCGCFWHFSLGKEFEMRFFEAADGDMRTACGASPSLWERRDFLFSEERQAGSFWSWRHVFPDHKESQLKLHFCALMQGCTWRSDNQGRGPALGMGTLLRQLFYNEDLQVVTLRTVTLSFLWRTRISLCGRHCQDLSRQDTGVPSGAASCPLPGCLL